MILIGRSIGTFPWLSWKAILVTTKLRRAWRSVTGRVFQTGAGSTLRRRNVDFARLRRVLRRAQRANHRRVHDGAGFEQEPRDVNVALAREKSIPKLRSFPNVRRGSSVVNVKAMCGCTHSLNPPLAQGGEITTPQHRERHRTGDSARHARFRLTVASSICSALPSALQTTLSCG